MSALNRLLGLPDDPREVELVQGLIDKTKQGRIPWARQATAYTASIPRGLEMNFVISPSLFSPAPSWELFTVRDANGIQLLRVPNPRGGSLMVTSPNPENPVVTAADNLFRTVRGALGDDLDRAIDTIKKL
jgi:hypothetical protein